MVIWAKYLNADRLLTAKALPRTRPCNFASWIVLQLVAKKSHLVLDVADPVNATIPSRAGNAKQDESLFDHASSISMTEDWK